MTTSQPKRSCNSLTEALTSVSHRPAQRHGQPPSPQLQFRLQEVHLTCSGLSDGMGTPLAASRSSSMAGCMACACSHHGHPPKAASQVKWDETAHQWVVLSSTHLGPCSQRSANFSSPPGIAPTHCTGPSSWPALPRRLPAPWWRRFAGLCVRCERGCSGGMNGRRDSRCTG